MITATPHEADRRAREIETVRAKAVERHAPRKRADDEDPAVCGEHAPEVGVGLEARDDAVEAEREDAERHDEGPLVLLDADPDR